MKALFLSTVILVMSSGISFAQEVDEELKKTIMTALEDINVLERLSNEKTPTTLHTEASYRKKICSLKVEIKNDYMSLNAHFSKQIQDLPACHNEISTFIKREMANY